MRYSVGCLLCAAVVLGSLSAGGTPGSSGVQNDEVKMEFSHIGIVTTDKKPDERFVEATRVWVTDFRAHPFHVEWLRFEPDSPVTGPLREQPHVAYCVASIEQAAGDMKVLAEPFDPGVFGVARVGFYQTKDGAVIEFMEMKENQEQ